MKNDKFILGVFVGILLAFIIGGLIWAIATGNLFIRVDRTNPISTTRAIAIAFLEKNHDDYIEFIPPTYSQAFQDGWWENGEFLSSNWVNGCGGKANEEILNLWLGGSVRGYKITDVLVTEWGPLMESEVLFTLDGNQYSLKFFLEKISNKWWVDRTICFDK